MWSNFLLELQKGVGGLLLLPHGQAMAFGPEVKQGIVSKSTPLQHGLKQHPETRVTASPAHGPDYLTQVKSQLWSQPSKRATGPAELTAGKGKGKVWEDLKLRKRLGGPREPEAAVCRRMRLEETAVLLPTWRLLS